jgi:hypothetical protein
MGKIKIKPGRNAHEVEKVSEAVDTVAEQLNGFGKGFFDQLIGFSLNNKTDSTEKSPDKPLIVKSPTGQIDIFHAANAKNENTSKKYSAERVIKPEIRGAIDYHGEFVKSSERAMQVEMNEVNKRLQDIMGELQRLISSSKVLKTEFANVTMQQAPTQAGEYHLNFFDWLLLTIRAARQKVEDSGAWLTAVKNKKNKKGYWNMFKKHGTSFGLSNERSIATQAG